MECNCYINKYGTVFFTCKYQSKWQNYLAGMQITIYENDINYCPKCGSKLIKVDKRHE